MFGMLAGLIISVIGSFLFGLYPYLPPFYILIAITAVPSILIFGFSSLIIQRDGELTYWLISFGAIFLISVTTFTIWTYIDEFMEKDGWPLLNWSGIIFWDLLYSLSLAVILSPLGYIALKSISKLFIARRKNKT